VTVQSEPGQGTTFTVYLPCVNELPAEEEKQGVGSRADVGSETILLVEDDDMLRKLLSESLKMSGYRSFRHATAAKQWLSVRWRAARCICY